MTVATFAVAVVTVLVGAVLLAETGLPDAASPPRGLLRVHFLIALAGLVVFGIGVSASAAAAWAGVIILLAAIVLGATAYMRTRALPGKQPPNVALVIHGVGAAIVVLAAAAAVAHK